MNFKPSRTFAEELMNDFIENNLVNYSKLRNFDYGPDKRSNVSCLSPYVTHGVISEVELIKKSLNKYSFVKNEKFIQEIMWRTFWKGWMELRPDVWADYLLELNQIKDKYKNDQDYKKVFGGSDDNGDTTTPQQTRPPCPIAPRGYDVTWISNTLLRRFK